MATPRVYATRYDPDRPTKSVVFKASVDTQALTSTALLSYPEKDLAGDLVVPEGMDFSRHMADPRVDLEHRRTADFGDATVGWAHSTCKKSDGYYTVRPVNLACHDGTTRPLPVGTTYFDRSDRLQVQAFTLVEQGILPCVSVEFIPDMTVAKSLGRSQLEPRDAYEFPRVSVVRYTLCAKGVCPSATVLKSVYDPLAAVLSANRIGGEPLHPTIFKAFAHRLPGKSNLVTSGYVEKADMDPYTGTATTEPVEAAPEPESTGATPTAQVGYDGAQMLTDLCEHIKAGIKDSEHKPGKKKLLKLCDAVEALVAKFMAVGDMVAADVCSDGDMEADDEEPEVPAEDTEPDEDDGVMKGMKKPERVVYLKALSRYTLAQVQKAEAEQAAPVDSPEDKAELARELELVRKERARAARDLKLYG